MKINYLIALLFLFCFAGTVQAYKTVSFFSVEHRDVISKENLQIQEEFNGYTVSVYRNKEGFVGIVQILEGKEIVFEEENHVYEIYLFNKDITGDGEPNLIIKHWSGGAHCCYDYYVFSLGEEFHFIDKIQTEHGGGHFEDVDGDGIAELLVNDFAFAYWNECFAASPAPRVVLKYKKGKYAIAYGLMKKSLSDVESQYDIRTKNDNYRSDCSDGFGWEKEGVCILSNIWSHMLNLIYTGHPEEAWRFLDDIWPADEETKNDFLGDFKRQLAISDFADDLPVDLEGYRPDIQDENEKVELRFKTYYDKIINIMDLNKEESRGIKPVPDLNSSNENELRGVLKRWSGQNNN